MHNTRVRVIPCLLLKNESLVKTVKFKEFNYVGDPVNTVRIFNELEVDELSILDICATKEKRPPNFKILEKLANECFMPLSYGGGIRNFEDAKRIFSIGFEKVVLNSIVFEDPKLLTQISDVYGSQAVVVSIDYKKNIFGSNVLYSKAGTQKENVNLLEWVQEAENLGAGEVLLTNIDRDGTWSGYDIKTMLEISSRISLPLVANGGARDIASLVEAIRVGGASAVGVGSMVVYQKKDMGVLINFPDKKKLKEAFSL